MNFIKSLPITLDMVSLWVPSGTSAIDLIRGNHGQCSGTHPNVPVNTGLIDPTLGWHFDGSNDYIDCGVGGSLNMGTLDFSGGAWIKTALTSDGNILTKMKSSTNYPGYSLIIQADGTLKLTVQSHHNIDSFIIVTTSAFNDDMWHFIVFTVDRSEASADDALRIYVDGSLEGITEDNEAGDITASIDNTNSFYLGIEYDASSCPFSDYIALPFIAKSAWSLAQVNNFFLATKGLFSPRS